MAALCRPATGPALAALVVAALAGTALAGCGTTAAPTPTAHETESAHNHADAAFAAEMVPHHEQGLYLVELAGRRDVSAELVELTGRMAAEQAADVGQLETWLTAWDEEPPYGPRPMADEDTMTTRSKTSAMRGLMRSRMGPWALGTDEVDDLGECRSARFEDRWLRMMITHHQGAISMARHEMAAGEYPPAVALAEHIVTTQQAEVEEMRDLLRD